MINLEDYKMSALDGAGLYCGTYKKYNEGSIEGMWIDLESVFDAEEFFEVCRALHADETDPEFMFQDYQGFPESMYHESMGADEIQVILDYLELDEDEREMLEAYCDCTGENISDFDDFMCRAKESYCGQHDSFRDFTDQQADEMLDQYESMCEHSYDCKGALGMVQELRRYFDYEAFARNLEQDYYISDSGHIFYAR